MPRVIVNFAMSADGKIALPSRAQTRISSEEDMERVHRLRASVDAILVGVGTVLADDPTLTVKRKYVEGMDGAKEPMRIVLDSRGRTPESAKVLQGRGRTLIVVAEDIDREWPGAERLVCGRGRVDLHRLMDTLDEMGVESLMVEGGSEVIWSFISEGLASEVKVYVGSMVIGGSGSPTPAGGEGFQALEECARLELNEVTRLGDGVLLEYAVRR